MLQWLASFGRDLQRWLVGEPEDPSAEAPSPLASDGPVALPGPVQASVLPGPGIQLTAGLTTPDGQTHVIYHRVGAERYVIVFRHGERERAQAAAGAWARNAGLSFDWYAAALVAEKARELSPDPVTFSEERVRLDRAPPADAGGKSQPAGAQGNEPGWEPHPGLGELPRGYEGEQECGGI